MTGIVALLRANLRRDRVLLPAWVLGLAAMVAVSAVAVADLYADSADRIAAARVINSSPALVALYGPILNESSAGELAMSKMTVMYAMFVMGMALVIVRRHTRTEEETGRAELMAATLVGRQAPLRAAVIQAAGASVLLGLLGAAANVGAGLPVAGSLGFGLSWIGIGLVGTGLAAVASQLSASARTCGGIGVAAIAVMDVFRAAGDTGPDLLGWLSPLGWGTRLDAWGSPRWWVLILYVALAAALILTAEWLRSRRDLGQGLLPARPGPAVGAIGSMRAVTWRLNRLMTAWWLVASGLWGVLFGSIAPHLGGLFDSPQGKAALEALGGKGRVQETMLAALLAIMAALLSAYAIQVVVGSAREETDSRTSLLLAHGGTRAQAFGATVALALLGSASLAVCYGVGSAVGFGSQVDGVWSALGSLVPAALAHVPAMWVVASLAVLIWAVRPGAAPLGWVLLLAFVTLGEFGELLKLPAWARKLSPFEHVVNVPVQPVDWSSEIGLVVVTMFVLALAWLAYRARDIAG